MGKMTLEYLSISLARIPKILSGGAWGGLSWISTTLGCWCWWKMPIILHTPPWKKGEVNENIQLRRGQKKGVNLARLSFFYGYPMHCGAEGAFFGTPGCSDTDCKIIVRAVFCIWCQTWVFCLGYRMCTCGGAGGDGGGGGAAPLGHSLQPVGSRFIRKASGIFKGQLA